MRSPYGTLHLPARHKESSAPRGETHADAKYIGMYYWSDYWRQWDKIIDVQQPFVWVVQSMKVRRLSDEIIIATFGPVRTHRTPMKVEHIFNRFFVAEER